MWHSSCAPASPSSLQRSDPVIVTQPIKIGLGLRGQRSLREKLLPRLAVVRCGVILFAAAQRGRADDQAISAKCFLIEKDFRTQAQRAIQLAVVIRSEEHTSELQSLRHLVCRLLLE